MRLRGNYKLFEILVKICNEILIEVLAEKVCYGTLVSKRACVELETYLPDVHLR